MHERQRLIYALNYYLLTYRQAGDLGRFKCPVSCAKPYISVSWYQKHLSKCPQPTRAIKGWSEVTYLLIYLL